MVTRLWPFISKNDPNLGGGREVTNDLAKNKFAKTQKALDEGFALIIRLGFTYLTWWFISHFC
jgi:hypothetical protein